MRGQGKPVGEVQEVNWNIEKRVVDQLSHMQKGSSSTVEEMVHIALNRFISTHKDWLEPKEQSA